MTDYGRPVEFGVSVAPAADELATARAVAERADAEGIELLGIQDHPYQRRFVETWSLMGDLLARTQRLRIFPDVANLPLRLPAMIAKQAASLDLLSGGRFELGLGAGAFWEGVEAMGGPRRTGGESVDALEEAIEIIRAFWSGERGLRVPGRHYSLAGVHGGPPPAHPIGIWVGGYQPRMLNLVGRLADGWVPSLGYAPPETIPARARRIDEAAAAAGRDPGSIRRLYNVPAEAADAETLTHFAVELGFDTFVVWLAGDGVTAVERLAQDVAPAVRAAVAESRGT